MAPHKEPQKFSEPQLTGSTTIFQAIAEMGNVGIVVLDEYDHIEFANKMASQITGYGIETLLGKNVTELLDEKNKQLFQTLKRKSNTNTKNIYIK